MLLLKDKDFIAKGNERAIYLHPEDENKTIKVTYKGNKRQKSKQSEKEISYYKELENRGINNWKHLPKFFGEVKTSKGDGFIIELIRDYDGEVSKSFAFYLEKNGVEFYQEELKEYKNYFLDNYIIFNYGMMPKNILLRKNSKTDFDLVLIDGLGDVTYFTFPNKIPYFVKKKINRRWTKFIEKYC